MAQSLRALAMHDVRPDFLQLFADGADATLITGPQPAELRDVQVVKPDVVGEFSGERNGRCVQETTWTSTPSIPANPDSNASGALPRQGLSGSSLGKDSRASVVKNPIFIGVHSLTFLHSLTGKSRQRVAAGHGRIVRTKATNLDFAGRSPAFEMNFSRQTSSDEGSRFEAFASSRRYLERLSRENALMALSELIKCSSMRLNRPDGCGA